ncbi:putative ribonuclease H-like domain, reverse transcriptase zinc-binding domain-containing protein [Senna tora]|uniref:Putative ribonuclease H-like domain, reverse transcriptase zinc-binding domain-containing protein n=1 Tax=Senna tora TaxID=362788 RepID=A0A834XBN5_9FABA|nr:putative ribonuclease H-like domain, reverse transcriptase zinc-binding domain-containing protein [Senna tora]
MPDLIRYIGNEKTTSVWDDAWLPGDWHEINLFPDLQGRVSDGFWKHLLKLPVLPKHKAFLWRACLGILPTNYALAKRGVEIDERCEWCGNEEESSFHVLVECPLLQQFWAHSRFDFSSMRWHGSLVEWLDVEGSWWSTEQWGLCTIALYLVWEMRNLKKFESILPRMEQLWCKVTLLWEEMEEVSHNVKGRETSLSRWEKPSGAAVKLNTDAGTLPMGGGIVGGVIRNSDGHCVGAFTEGCGWSTNPMVLEAEAIRRGIEFALSLGTEDIIVECDAKLVIDFLCSGGSETSPLLLICNQIKLLCGSFKSSSFRWVPRCCNKVAHFLVSLAKDSIQDVRWVDSLPIALSDVIWFDV